jgi:transposase InsO family protein
MPTIDLRADLNAEDDQGRWWSLLRDAVDPAAITPGAAMGTVEDVELATLGWVHWHNTIRLHGYLGDVSPAEFEAAFYAAQSAHQTMVGIQ